jgi:flavin-dependent dehydrogenase
MVWSRSDLLSIRGKGLSSYAADVVITGAGPVGLAAAIALRVAGADVLIVDAQKPSPDKACGEGLMPDSRRELLRLGIDPASTHGVPFKGVRFADSDFKVDADFIRGEGLGVRRLALHQLLLDRAAGVGVRMLWETRVHLQPAQEPRINGEALRYRYLIGADGESSRTRAWAGLCAGRVSSRRFGFRAHFEFEDAANHPGSERVEVHWGDEGQAYVTPVGSGKVCVAVVSRLRSPGTFKRVVDSIPALREPLSRARQLTTQRGAVTTTSVFDRVTRHDIALVGDASGSVDAITGEGLAIGFRQALLLRDSIVEGGLGRYQAEHADISRLPRKMARVLLLMDQHPRLRRRLLRVLAANPELFAAMLRVHLNEERFTRIVLRHGVEFGRRLALPI